MSTFARCLEALFRHKLLLMIPPLLITLIVTPVVIFTAPFAYESITTVWVDRPAYFTASSSDVSSYLSPAQNQSNSLNELLHTQNFLNDVAARTSLAPLTETVRGQDRISTMINTGLTILPTGNHLIVLRFRAQTPQIAFETLNAIVQAFKDNATNESVNQAVLATSFYEGRLKTAQDQLDKASADLQRYVTTSPRLNDPNRDLSAPQGASVLALDPQLITLQKSLDSRQAEVDRVHASIQQAQLGASASLEGQELAFRVVDPAKLATSGGRDLKKRIVFPAAGLLVGLLLSSALLVLLVLGDRSVRSEADLAPPVRVLGVIPSLQSKRLPKRAGPQAARRAIAFTAGAALPAPKGSH